ncbi:ABC transporter permease [Streptomyces sp. RB6PN25]|uniref:ABC transporter permease n=1 Tax=Streptomyces humicola TaxID=2953240 RepID=A0ABT1PVE9_9ACTN|nr:ABC transporter permease [Streptomyces humicola]MCQ4081649.1 ABC transporter permease [Streptomyces humicola]
MMRTFTGTFTGTPSLVRLALRRDRIMIPAWVLSLAVIVIGTASSISTLYPTEAGRASLAASMAANGSLRALYGPVYGTSIGGLTAWRMGSMGPALAGLMTLLLVVRHTREEEEAGRLELVGAGVVGRRAPLTASLITGCGASLLLALLITLGLLTQGAVGAVAFGLAFGAVGCVFAAVAAVTAQLTESARAAKGIAGALLGVAFLVRATGDAAAPGGPEWVAWLSPLGWAERLHPYAHERWWVLALFAGVIVLLVTAAYALVAGRDLDAGLLPSRPGPERAGRRLRGAYGLAWRLQRGSLWGWAFGYAVSGLVFGATGKGIADLGRTNKSIADEINHLGGTHSLVDSFLAAMINFLGMLAAVYIVQAVLRLRGEESDGRAEPVLATAVGRLRWAASHLVIAAAGSVVLMVAGGIAMGIGYGASVSDVSGQVPRMTGAGLVQLPAVLFVGALAVLILGAAPKMAMASWSAASLTLAIGLYGPLLKLSRWVLDLSAFTHLPKVPTAPATATPLLWLLVLTAALTASGLAALRHRDMG